MVLFHNSASKGRVWECGCGTRFSSKAQGELHLKKCKHKGSDMDE